uniref:C2H2-type domain-containing protein n=1 Tax=Esox lucius TaxID=8010 RepID=A0A3P8Z1C8_ESOLU
LGTPLLLPSLRLFIPPLRLVSAAMWQVVLQGHVQDYGMLEEFVTTVTEIVPELLSSSQRAQLILGLRARDVFPVEFGPQYDTAIQINTIVNMSVPDPRQLRTLLQYHRKLGHVESVGGEGNVRVIISSLSLRPYVRVVSAPDVASDTRSEKMHSEGTEAAEMSESQPEGSVGLVAADDVPRCIITEQGFAMDMQSAVVEIDSQAVTSLNSLRISRFQPLKRTDSCGRPVKQLSPSNVLPTLKKSFKRAQFSKTCEVCGKTFTRVTAMKRHQLTHTGDLKFKCLLCEKQFRDGSRYLRTHKRIHSPFYCSDCGRVLPNSIAFERHKLVQHKEIQCTMCEKTFTLLGRLRDHYLHQHKFTGPYPCSQCEKTFIELRYLVEHETIHSGEFPYQCSVCQKKFRTAKSLTLHSRKHTGEKPFLCWQCGKSYKDHGNLAAHMGTHSEEKPFSCSQCEMTYRTKIQLNTHIEQVHDGVRYTCSICGKQFLKAVSVKRHELTHTGERPWPCSYCTKTFITANERRLHERYHTGERPYKCQECGKSFVQSCFLKSHQRLHTGERPFACSICDKSFRLNYHKQRHEQTHTGKNKPHVCGECGLAFTQRKRLTEHQRTHSLN